MARGGHTAGTYTPKYQRRKEGIYPVAVYSRYGDRIRIGYAWSKAGVEGKRAQYYKDRDREGFTRKDYEDLGWD